MALVTRSATAHPSAGDAMFAQQGSGDFEAGEALDPVAPCYIATTGKIFMCDGTAADVKAVVRGWTPKAYALGAKNVTLHVGGGIRYNYVSGTALTPGVKLFIAATKGRLDTAATTGDSVGVAQVEPDGVSIRTTRLI